MAEYTSKQDRMDILSELSETLHSVLRGGWAECMTVERDGSALEGRELALVWMDDGTVEVREHRNGDTLLTVQVEITVSPVVNTPTGFVARRTWGTVPVGWFVQSPKGELHEVTDRDGDTVYVKINGVHTPIRRDPSEQVPCKRGTLAPPDEVDTAVDVLKAGGFSAEVISDQIS